MLDLLTQLIDKSLVQYEETPLSLTARDGAERFRYCLLETVRQYARDRLLEAGEAERVQGRHREWFASLAEEAEPELLRPEQTDWLERLEAELDNFRAALHWTLERGEGEEAVRLAGALWRFLYVRGHLNEGRQWLERALSASPDMPTAARARALHGAAVLWHEQHQFDAARCFEEESLAIWHQRGDTKAIADSLDQLGHIVNAQGDYERATSLFEESLKLRWELGDRSGAAASLNALGWMARFHGDFERATALCAESLALRREISDKWGTAYSLEFLAEVAAGQGDNERAMALAQESLALREQLGDQRGMAASLHNLGRVANSQGDRTAALAYLEKGLLLWRSLGVTQGIAGCLSSMASVVSAQGDLERGARLYRESLALW